MKTLLAVLLLPAAARAAGPITNAVTAGSHGSAVVTITPGAGMAGIAATLGSAAAAAPVQTAGTVTLSPAAAAVAFAAGRDQLRPHGYRGQDKYDDYVTPYPRALNDRAEAMAQVKRLADEAAKAAKGGFTVTSFGYDGAGNDAPKDPAAGAPGKR